MNGCVGERPLCRICRPALNTSPCRSRIVALTGAAFPVVPSVLALRIRVAAFAAVLSGAAIVPAFESFP